MRYRETCLVPDILVTYERDGFKSHYYGSEVILGNLNICINYTVAPYGGRPQVDCYEQTQTSERSHEGMGDHLPAAQQAGTCDQGQALPATLPLYRH